MSKPLALAVGAIGVGAVITALSVVLAPSASAPAYLAGVTFLLTVALGAVFLGATLRLSGARWAAPLQPIYSALSASLPLVLVLIAPVVLRLDAFYPWARPGFEGRGGLIHSPHYFGRAPFTLRLFVELGFLVGIEEATRRRTLSAPRTQGWPTSTSRPLAAAALVATAFIGTSAIDDLVMSTAGEWSSDVFGLYTLVGGFGAAMAALAVAALVLRSELEATPSITHAMANVALIAVSLWGYLAFAFFFLVWIADVPREVPFFLARTEGAWRPIFILLVIGRFLVPLLLLLRQRPKRDARYVAAVGAWILLMHAVDSTWLVVPGAVHGLSAWSLGPILLIGGAGALLAILRYRRHRHLATNEAAIAARFAYRPA